MDLPTSQSTTSAATAATGVAKSFQNKSDKARLIAYAMFTITMMIALAILSLFLFSKQIDAGSTIIESSIRGEMKETNQRTIENSIIGILLNTAVVRIGAVLVGIFVIQILVGFCRYYFRLSDHLSTCSEIVLLSNGDPKKMKDMASVLIPQFDFSKTPASPVQKIAEVSVDAIKELTKRIPIK